jgi:hypothetical protein
MLQLIFHVNIHFYIIFNKIAKNSFSRKKSKISILIDDSQKIVNNKINVYNNSGSIKEEINEKNFSNEYSKNGINNRINYKELCINEEENHHYIINDANNYFDYIKKFKIYFYVKINENNEFVFPIKSDFINIKKKCVCDLIKHIVKKINNKKIVIRINSKEYTLSLKDSDDDSNNIFYDSNYELKEYAPKNLNSINHSDGYSSNILLKELVNKKICFTPKNPINIMLVEHYDSCKNGILYNIDKNSFNNKYKGKKKFGNNCFIKFISNCFENLIDYYNISSDI